MLLFRRLGHDIRGATMVEYGLVVALIVIAMLVGFQILAGSVVGMWESINTQVGNASS